MRATLIGIAVTLAGLGAAAPASALPMPGAVAPDAVVHRARVVSRTVIRGPRCKTVVTKRRGPLGRVVVVRKRRCF